MFRNLPLVRAIAVASISVATTSIPSAQAETYFRTSPHTFGVAPKTPQQSASDIVLSGTTLDFSIADGSTRAASKSVTVTNKGSTPIASLIVDDSGTNIRQFYRASWQTQHCKNKQSLAAGASCTIEYQFQTGKDGTWNSSTYRAGVGTSSSDMQYVLVSGRAQNVKVAKLELSVSRLDFVVDGPFGWQEKTLRIANNGTGDAALRTDPYTIGTYAEDPVYGFRIDGSYFDQLGCQSPLQPGSYCDVTISWRPVDGQDADAKFGYTDDNNPDFSFTYIPATGRIAP